MDCKQPSISDKLVPFVEGALAEPDRREVQDHLPNCPTCANEVKLVKAMIGKLRSATARGLAYRPGTNLAPEDLVEYALFGDQLSPETRRRIQLTVLESVQLQTELSLLNDLERQLSQKAEPDKAAPPVLPPALRQAIAKTYGATKAPPARPSAFNRLNVRRMAIAAGLLVVLGVASLAGGTLFKHLLGGEQQVATAPTPVNLVASTARRAEPPVSATPTSEPAPPPPASRIPEPKTVSSAQSKASTSPAPPKEVALETHRIDQRDFAEIAKQLTSHGVGTYTYHDGQIFTTPHDADRARAVIYRYEHPVVASHPAASAEVAVGGPAAPYGGRAQPMIQAPHRAPVPVPADRGARVYRSAPTAHYVAPPARFVAASGGSGGGVQTHHVGVVRHPHTYEKRLPAHLQIAGVAEPVKPGALDLARSRRAQREAHARVRQTHALALASKPHPSGAIAIAPPAAPVAMGFTRKKAADVTPPLPTEVEPSIGDTNSVESYSARSAAANAPAAAVATPASLDQALQQAQQIVHRIIGDAQVELAQKPDHTLLITVRAAHKLSLGDVDHLRTTLRKEMHLSPFDTILIRQP